MVIEKSSNPASTKSPDPELVDQSAVIISTWKLDKFILFGNKREVSFHSYWLDDVTISKLAKMIKEVVKYDGDIIFDKTQKDGTSRKVMDVALIKKLGWQARTSLKTGLKASYQDFLLKNENIKWLIDIVIFIQL